MNLNDYVLKRNGVPMGHSKSLGNNLYRSLGAKNFPTFWTYWNPIFGYHLGKYIFKPLKKWLPISLALLLTFVFCGMIHDAVAMAIRREYVGFFSLWFLFMGSFVVLFKRLPYDLSNKHWAFRTFSNVSILGTCFLLTYYLHENVF